MRYCHQSWNRFGVSFFIDASFPQYKHSLELIFNTADLKYIKHHLAHQPLSFSSYQNNTHSQVISCESITIHLYPNQTNNFIKKEINNVFWKKVYSQLNLQGLHNIGKSNDLSNKLLHICSKYSNTHN